MIDCCIATCKEKHQIQNQIDEIERFTRDCRIIASCQPVSAAINRNFCLEYANTEFIVMVDDDIIGFYENWLEDLIKPMIENKDIIIIAPILENPRGLTQMGVCGNHIKADIFPAVNNRVTTACIVIRKNFIRFDEKFIGSGFEDTDYCLQIKQKYGENRIWINTKVKLIHLNEMKNQGGKYFEHNHKLFLEKYPDDNASKNQKDWVK